MVSSLRLAVAVCTAALALPPPALAGQTQGVSASQVASGGRTIRVTGVVRDEQNAMTMPGATISVVGTSQVTVTDVDGRYTLDLPQGHHRLKVAMDGYQERTIDVEAATERTLTADVSLSMTKFAEEVTVTGQASDAATSTQEAQLVERKNSLQRRNPAGGCLRRRADGLQSLRHGRLGAVQQGQARRRPARRGLRRDGQQLRSLRPRRRHTAGTIRTTAGAH